MQLSARAPLDRHHRRPRRLADRERTAWTATRPILRPLPRRSACGSTRSSPRRTCSSRIARRRSSSAVRGSLTWAAPTDCCFAIDAPSAVKLERGRLVMRRDVAASDGPVPQSSTGTGPGRSRWLPRGSSRGRTDGRQPVGGRRSRPRLPMGLARQERPRQLPLGHDPALAPPCRLRDRPRTGPRPRAQSHAPVLAPCRHDPSEFPGLRKRTWHGSAVVSGWVTQRTEVVSESGDPSFDPPRRPLPQLRLSAKFPLACRRESHGRSYGRLTVVSSNG